MSFVLCICTNSFSIIMCDGRLINTSNGEIINEKTKKIERINKDVAIGYTGNPIPIVYAMDKIERCNTNILSLEEIEQIFIDELKLFPSHQFNVNLIITGKNVSGKFTIHTANSKSDYKISVIYPLKNGLIYSCSGNNEHFCNQIVKNNIFNVQITSFDHLISLMEKCFCDVSNVDNTVNKNIFKDVIE